MSAWAVKGKSAAQGHVDGRDLVSRVVDEKALKAAWLQPEEAVAGAGQRETEHSQKLGGEEGEGGGAEEEVGEGEIEVGTHQRAQGPALDCPACHFRSGSAHVF